MQRRRDLLHDSARAKFDRRRRIRGFLESLGPEKTELEGSFRKPVLTWPDFVTTTDMTVVVMAESHVVTGRLS